MKKYVCVILKSSKEIEIDEGTEDEDKTFARDILLFPKPVLGKHGTV